ncbi:MAG: RsmB/NOP family class I SAM-dependent RNA methyltransferase [Candidatus Delongbacteria bacterium]|nr:RsmB/NOP family class I SAM-dependent RNA methyltransferase [Candidatus Delongbacteria bacterium]
MTLKQKVQLIHHLLRHRHLIIQQHRDIQSIFEHYSFFDYLLDDFAEKPKKWPDYLKAVHYGVCDEIFNYSANVDALTINTALQLIKKSRWPFYVGFFQALFSHLSHNKEQLVRDYRAKAGLAGGAAHPEWMVKRWIDRYGLESTRQLLEFNNQKPSLYLVVNPSKIRVTEYMNQLQHHSIHYLHPFPEIPVIRIDDPVHVDQLPGYGSGWFWIQDPSAVLVIYLVQCLRLDRILDVCAAPGGKSFMLAGLFPEADITACDHALKKIGRLRENCERLGFNRIGIIQADGLSLPFRPAFDLILLDAPCSGLGVIQRKGDIRWSKQENHIIQLADLQKRLLDQAADHLRPGGYLLYATCTLEPEETDWQIRDFLNRHPDFKSVCPQNAVEPLRQMIRDGFYYSIPQHDHLAGAFAALLQKSSQPSP